MQTASCKKTCATDKGKIWQRCSPKNDRTCSEAKNKKETMKLRYSVSDIESDDTVLLHYDTKCKQNEPIEKNRFVMRNP